MRRSFTLVTLSLLFSAAAAASPDGGEPAWATCQRDAHEQAVASCRDGRFVDHSPKPRALPNALCVLFSDLGMPALRWVSAEVVAVDLPTGGRTTIQRLAITPTTAIAGSHRGCRDAMPTSRPAGTGRGTANP